MSNWLTKLAITGLLFSASSIQAFEDECLQAPSRTKSCPNLVYRSVEQNNIKKMFCFCKTDFRRMLDKNAKPAEKIFNKMEWRQVLAETGYSDRQLKTFITQ